MVDICSYCHQARDGKYIFRAKSKIVFVCNDCLERAYKYYKCQDCWYMSDIQHNASRHKHKFFEKTYVMIENKDNITYLGYEDIEF